MTDEQEPIFTERMAQNICHRALLDGECGKLLNTLADGGGVTIDPVTMRLVFITAEQLESLHIIDISERPHG